MFNKYDTSLYRFEKTVLPSLEETCLGLLEKVEHSTNLSILFIMKFTLPSQPIRCLTLVSQEYLASEFFVHGLNVSMFFCLLFSISTNSLSNQRSSLGKQLNNCWRFCSIYINFDGNYMMTWNHSQSEHTRFLLVTTFLYNANTWNLFRTIQYYSSL